MPSPATTVDAYLASLPADRRATLDAVRETIRAHLPAGYEEGMQYGMIGYYVPHRLYPAGYHANPKEPLPLAALAAQKSHLALYLMGVYGDEALEAWFRGAWAQAGQKLDMGKSCVRFKTLDQVPLAVVGEVFARLPVAAYVARYEATLGGAAKKKAPAKEKAPAPAKEKAPAPTKEKAPAPKKKAPAPKKKAPAPKKKAPAAKKS